MSDAPHSDSQHRRPHAPPMAAPFLEFDLKRELEQLHSEPEWGTGQNARTLVKYPDDFASFSPRSKRERACRGIRRRVGSPIQTVVGHIQVRAQGRTFDLPAGQSARTGSGHPS